MSLEVNEQVLETDPEGYLRDLTQWTEAVATSMAEGDGIESGVA